MPSNAASPTPSRARRLAGSGALVATAAGLGALAVHDLSWVEWSMLAFAGVVGLAGVGLGRRSMTGQVLSRATAWTVFAPSLLVTIFSVGAGHPEWLAAAFAAGSGGALLLARPMLHTAEARAAFAPSSFRRWLLASATASAVTGIVAGLFGLDSLHWHGTGTAVALLALAASLLGSTIGIMKMRAWGILLGGLTSVVTLGLGLWFHDAVGFSLTMASVPGFMMLLPVLLAAAERKQAARRADASAASFTRVAAHVGYDDLPRVRVATGASDTASESDLDASDDARAPSPPAAARLQA